MFNSGRVKLDNKTSIYCYFVKHAALRSNSKDLLAHNKGIVFEWSDMSTGGLYKSNKACWSGTKRTLSLSLRNVTSCRHDTVEAIVHLVVNNNC